MFQKRRDVLRKKTDYDTRGVHQYITRLKIGNKINVTIYVSLFGRRFGPIRTGMVETKPFRIEQTGCREFCPINNAWCLFEPRT